METKERVVKIRNSVIKFFYKSILKRLFFCFEAEAMHAGLTDFGNFLGRYRSTRWLTSILFFYDNPVLIQNVAGINFKNPIGLSAGFDYQVKLTDIIPAVGFGFGTIGTITNNPYGGNPKPMLGRLIKSRSLMVNKGFKNDGVHRVVEKLAGKKFNIPLGISLGKTNGQQSVMTQEEAIQDIVSAFKAVEISAVPFSYYELNISCPNLFGSVEFYSVDHLRDLLIAVTGLKLTKPLFIKMPIEKSNEDVLKMMEVITSYPVAGVIFGNLQKNRQDPSLDPEEVKKFSKGYFSGKPTEVRSNELIGLVYKNYCSKIIVVGCGGVFSAEDAYKKIKLGATLIQMITGLIFEGPEIISEINRGLVELLKKDGFNSINQAIGIDNKNFVS